MNAWDIRHDYSPDLDLIYILAKREQDAADDAFIPIDMHNEITTLFLTQVQNELGLEVDGSRSKK